MYILENALTFTTSKHVILKLFLKACPQPPSMPLTPLKACPHSPHVDCAKHSHLICLTNAM